VPHAHSWLLVVVSTGGSSTLRVYAWRRLRSLGALYLQSSVCLLPRRPETERAVSRLAARLQSEGGECRTLVISFDDDGEEREIVAAFSAERSDEYAEICSRTPAFLEEIAMERARGRATYTEMEESEADLERLRKWLGRVRVRDYFDADGRAEAEAAVERCTEALAQFETEALAAEQPEGEPREAGGGRHLRAVDDE
jgi:ChrB-like protein